MNAFIKIRNTIRILLLGIRKFYFTKLLSMDIQSSARISYNAILDKTNPKGIHIGAETYIASGAIIFAHDFSRSIHKDTYIGKKTFIGANAIIMCGCRIGDECIIGAGSVVTKNIPSHCIAVGNPAKIIKTGIMTNKFGQMIKSNE